jgi:fructose-bisphosphate aldolase, class II
VRAAEAKRSPAMLLVFPGTHRFSAGLLAVACAHAREAASVPIALHMDHAQSAAEIRAAADAGLFDGIMIDMSRRGRADNLRLTRELAAYCHARGVAAEAEPGRIEGGEDGLAGTAEEELAGLLTTGEEAREFVAAGIDWLAPAFGNVHGSYGPRGIRLDYERLGAINEAVGRDVRLVLHGTDGFGEEEFRRCIEKGVCKINVNGAVNAELGEAWRMGLGTTATMEEATGRMQAVIEKLMDQMGSSGKAEGRNLRGPEDGDVVRA